MTEQGTKTQTTEQHLRDLMPAGTRFKIDAPQHAGYQGILFEVVRVDHVGVTAHDLNEVVSNSMACKTAYCFPWQGLVYKLERSQLTIS